MAAKIRLTREGVSDINLPSGLERHSWPLRVTAYGTGIPSEVFVWHSGVTLDLSGTDVFEAVASVAQMESLPIENRRVLKDGTVFPYYRNHRIEFACRSHEEMASTWAKIQADVNQLVLNWNLALALTSQEVVSATGAEVVVVDATEETTNNIYIPLSSIIVNETPAGVIDGDNAVFTIDYPPVGRTLQVFLNGVQVYADNRDFERAGQTLTFATPPVTGSRITVSYIKAT